MQQKKPSQHHQILKRYNIKKRLNKIQRNPTNEKKKKKRKQKEVSNKAKRSQNFR